MTWYIPSKNLRRAKQGTMCPACTIHLHEKDIIAWTAEDHPTLFMHRQCAELLFDTPDVEDVESEADDIPGEF